MGGAREGLSVNAPPKKKEKRKEVLALETRLPLFRSHAPPAGDCTSVTFYTIPRLPLERIFIRGGEEDQKYFLCSFNSLKSFCDPLLQRCFLPLSILVEKKKERRNVDESMIVTFSEVEQKILKSSQNFKEQRPPRCVTSQAVRVTSEIDVPTSV